MKKLILCAAILGACASGHETQRSDALSAQEQPQQGLVASSPAQNIEGKAVAARDDMLRVKVGDHDTFDLKVDDRTAVRLDGKQVSSAQIAPGSDVRASFQMIDGQAKALNIDVTSNQSDVQPLPTPQEQ